MMGRVRCFLQLVVCWLLACCAATAAPNPDWTAALPPFQIADNVFYVGSRDLAAYLVTTPAGNILINANLVSSPPQIRASVERLGFRWADTKILLNSQAHFDHVAGAAEVLRETHARNMAMEGDADVMASGGRRDFAFGTDGILTYPPARVERVLHDGERVELGGVTLTAHRTAGHTRGCTTWTLKAHLPGEPAGTLRDVVIVGGMAALSQYGLIHAGGRAESYPGIAADFEHTFATLRALPCDVFLGAHGQYFGMLGKLERAGGAGPSVWIDPQGYQAAVAAADRAFRADLDRQRSRAR